LAAENASGDTDNVDGGRIPALIPSLAARKRQRPVVIGPVVVRSVIVGSVIVGPVIVGPVIVGPVIVGLGVVGRIVAGVGGPIVARAPDMVLRNVVVLMVVRVVV
jgi:hypothetical protein